MTTNEAPERIALRWETGAAVTNGPLMTHPDYTRYIREDVAKRPSDPLDIPALAREVANFPETIRAHTVAAAIATEGMDVHQRLVKVEDVGRYVDRILSALVLP